MLAKDKEKVHRLIREMNQAWIEGRLSDLNPIFDERVVAVPPGGASRVEGREAMVDSFRQFLEIAKVHDYKVTDTGVEVFETTAVATFSFAISYELNGERYDETGWEILVLAKRDETWRIVWRTQIPGAPTA